MDSEERAGVLRQIVEVVDQDLRRRMATAAADEFGHVLTPNEEDAWSKVGSGLIDKIELVVVGFVDDDGLIYSAADVPLDGRHYRPVFTFRQE